MRVSFFSFLLKRSRSLGPYNDKGKERTTSHALDAVQVSCFTEGTCDTGCEDDESEFEDDEKMAVSGCSNSSNSSSSSRRMLRVVGWSSIVTNQGRWTIEQERELNMAEHELARCQKAWSSEQEIWLACIKDLIEEKEAHKDFLHMRSKQQDDEHLRFRKAWDHRRRSGDETRVSMQRNHSRFERLRRRRSSGSGSGSGSDSWIGQIGVKL